MRTAAVFYGVHNSLSKATNDNAAATALTKAQFVGLGSVAKDTFAALAAGEAPLKVMTQEGKARGRCAFSWGRCLGSK